MQIYVVTRFPEAGRILPVDGRMFGEFLNQQVGLTLLLSVFGGAGLIASDLQSGAILVYLSRPLTRRDYVLGKLGVLLALNLGVTLVPALALYGIGTAVAPQEYLRWDRAWIGPAIVIDALLIASVVSFVALAVSSLLPERAHRRPRFRRPLRRPRGGSRCRGDHDPASRGPRPVPAERPADRGEPPLRQRGPRSSAYRPLYPLVVLAVVLVICMAVLRSRVRAVEIVG